MKIGVISDTHLSEPSQALFGLMDTVFDDVALVLHAGDLTRMAVLEAFSEKEFTAVSGNMDSHDVTGKLRSKEVIRVNGYQIGLIHGWGPPGSVEDRIVTHFKGVDAIVYGHTHRSANHIRDNILLFNPGAFSGSFLFGRERSVGLLNVSDDGITGTIIGL